MVFSFDWKENVNTLFTVFTRLLNASLTLNWQNVNLPRRLLPI